VHTYNAPGTYTATVTVRDPGGASATDSVTITVTAAALGGSAAPQQQPAPPAGAVSGETRTRPLVSMPKAKKVRQVIRRGLRYRVSCEDACRVSSVLKLSGRRLGAARARLAAGASRTIVLRLDRDIRGNLLAAMRNAGVRRLKVTVVTRVATAAGTKTIRTGVTLKR
jgi:PKD repeat protein